MVNIVLVILAGVFNACSRTVELASGPISVTVAAAFAFVFDYFKFQPKLSVFL